MMTDKKKITPSYTFDTNVFVKFLDRADFRLAKYNDISLEGFSCFCKKELDIGDDFRVEINLKMISGGMIDDMKPHIATAKLLYREDSDESYLYHFQFTNFEDHCFTGLAIATEYLDKQENYLKLDTLKEKEIKNVENMSIPETINEVSEKISKGEIALPVLPKIVQEVEDILSKKNCSAEELSGVIEKDAVIASKLISFVNSPFYMGRSYIVNLKETIPRLGFAETRNLVLVIANKSLYTTSNAIARRIFESLWEHSLFSAYASRLIGLSVGAENSEALFTYGLVKNVGMTLLIRLLSEIEGKNGDTDMDEIVHNSINHNSHLTRLILLKWNFSMEDVENIVNFNKEAFDRDTKESTLILNVANNLAIRNGFGPQQNSKEWDELDSLKYLNVDINLVEEIGEKVKSMIAEAGNAI